MITFDDNASKWRQREKKSGAKISEKNFVHQNTNNKCERDKKRETVKMFTQNYSNIKCLAYIVIVFFCGNR